MQRRKEEGGRGDISRKEDIFNFFYPSFHFGALLSVKVADVTPFFYPDFYKTYGTA